MKKPPELNTFYCGPAEQVREGEGGGILCRTKHGRVVGMEVDFEGRGKKEGEEIWRKGGGRMWRRRGRILGES